MTDLPAPTSDRIKAARRAAGDSQRSAGERVHVAWRTWQKWEYGERQMPLAVWELYLIKTGQRDSPTTE